MSIKQYVRSRWIDDFLVLWIPYWAGLLEYGPDQDLSFSFLQLSCPNPQFFFSGSQEFYLFWNKCCSQAHPSSDLGEWWFSGIRPTWQQPMSSCEAHTYGWVSFSPLWSSGRCTFPGGRKCLTSSPIVVVWGGLVVAGLVQGWVLLGDKLQCRQ